MLLRFLFIALFSLGIGASATAQNLQAVDSSEVELRIPDEDRITSYQQDPDFNYDDRIQESEPWIFTFLSWIERVLNKIFGNKYGSSIWDIFLLILFVAALGLLLNAMFKGNIRSAFSGQSASKKLSINLNTESINELRIEELLNEALKKGDFKLAARYLYLKTLKMLDEKNLIALSQDKTNHEYLNEINDPFIRNSFSTLTLYHDYAEYGDFEIGDSGFQRMDESFNSILNRIARGD